MLSSLREISMHDVNRFITEIYHKVNDFDFQVL